MEHSSIKRIILVALTLSLVCSIVVSTAAVGLRPVQKINKQLDIQSNILQVVGRYSEGQSDEMTARQMALIEPRIIDLQSGQVLDMNPDDFDFDQVRLNAQLSRPLSRDEDIAQIKRLPHIMKIYLVKNPDGATEHIVFPIYGYGLWSTLYGFLAMETNKTTLSGLQFYDHKETPGLGGEVDNPRWRALWKNKRLYDKQGRLRIAVVRGRADRYSPDFAYQVDGLSGATLTSRGVSEMLRFWFGPLAYRNFLDRFAAASPGKAAPPTKS